jgi:hypothetical protein
MAEHVWMVDRTTWQMQLMWAVDAKEAVRLGDYAYAPVGGYDPPQPRQDTAVPVQRVVRRSAATDARQGVPQSLGMPLDPRGPLGLAGALIPVDVGTTRTQRCMR